MALDHDVEQFRVELNKVIGEDKTLCDAIMRFKYWHRNRKLEDCLILSGSSVEGCLLPRWFRPSEVKEVEADVMYLFATVPQDQKHRIECVQGQPGHVKLPYELIMENLVNGDIREKYAEYLKPKDGSPVKETPRYLSPMVCRALTQKLATLRDSNGITEQVVAKLWGTTPEDIGVEQEYGLTGASAMDSILIKVQGNNVLQLSIDHVAAVRLDFLPDPLQDWLGRHRKWPSPDMLAKMAAMGCHVVPKSSKEGDEETEWRFSFSIMEIFLAALRNQNPNVKKSYFIFKSIFYISLEPLVPDDLKDASQKTLTSFLGKTVMMWACESHPPMEDNLWEDGNLLKSVDYLLKQLEEHLESGFLSFYFIPAVNLLRDFDEKLLKLAASKIAEIRSDLTRHLPKGMDPVSAMAAGVSENLARFEEVATPFIQMSQFMKNVVTLCEEARRDK